MTRTGREKMTSPEVTGNAGTTYESRVAATYLASLLLEGGIRGHISASILTVSTQRGSLDTPLDDLKLTGTRNDRVPVMIAFQLKRSLTISAAETNKDFRDVIHRSWATLSRSDFQKGVDRIGVITEYPTNQETSRNFDRLIEYARNSNDPAEFSRKRSLFNASMTDIAKTLGLLLRERLGRDVIDEDLWTLLRHFVYLKIDVSETGGDREHSTDRLRDLLGDERNRAPDLFVALVDIAAGMSAAAGVLDRAKLLERLCGRFPISPPALNIAKVLPIIRSAAKDDLDRFLKAIPSTSHHLVNVLLRKNGRDHSAPQIDVSGVLVNGSNVVLEGGPGAGKSTNLLQQAQRTLEITPDRVAVVLQLPQLAISKRRIFEELAQRHSYKSTTEAQLRALAESGLLVLFCDGWNEMGADHQSFVRAELQSFSRDYPNCTFAFATRPSSSAPPALKPERYSLLPLTSDQKSEILNYSLGAQSADVLSKLRANSGLREIVGVPFYLDVLLKINLAEGIPGTREQLISRFIESHESDPRHKDQLKAVLADCQSGYLGDLATALNDKHEAHVSEKDLRATFLATANDLRSGGQIAVTPEPNSVKDILTSHHILTLEVEKATIGFQHQQFQEWYASLSLDQSILSASAAQDALDLVLKRFNDPFWEESFVFSIDRLLDSEKGRNAVCHILPHILGIDPVFAAEIIARLCDEDWRKIQDGVLSFLKVWHSEGNVDRGFVFMLRSGRPEFADAIWKVLGKQDQDGDSHFLSEVDGIKLRSFGDDWPHRSLSISEQGQGYFYSDLIHWGLDLTDLDWLVSTLGPTTPPKVFLEALQALDFSGLGNKIKDLVDKATLEQWSAIILEVELYNYLNDAQKKKSAADLKAYALKLEKGPKRLSYLIKVAEHSEEDLGETICKELVELEADRQAGDHFTKQVVPKHAKKLGEVIWKFFLGKRKVASHLLPYLIPAAPQAELLKLAMAEANRMPRDFLSLHLDVTSLAVLLKELLVARKEARTKRYSLPAGLTDRIDLLTSILSHARLDVLTDTLLSNQVTGTNDISTVLELIFRWNGDQLSDGRYPERTPRLEKLEALLKQYANALIRSKDSSRHDLCELASAIKAVRSVALVPTLTAALEEDLRRWEASKKAYRGRLAAGGSVSDRGDSHMSYVPIYAQAYGALYCKDSVDALTRFLHQPDFCVDAASVLIAFVRKEEGQKENINFGGPRFSEVSEARVRRGKTCEQTPHRYTALVLDQIDRLVAECPNGAPPLAMKLAAITSSVECGKREATIDRLLGGSRDYSANLAILTNKVLRGEVVAGQLLSSGLEHDLTDVLKTYHYSDQRWYQLDRWLCLLPFSDDIGLVPVILRHVSEKLAAKGRSIQAYELDSLVRAIGYSRSPKGVQILLSLREYCANVQNRWEWQNALGDLATQEAADYLVETLFSNPDELAHLFNANWRFSNIFGLLLRKFPAAKKALFDRLGGQLTLKTRKVVARILPEIVDQANFSKVWASLLPTGTDPFVTALPETVKEIATTQRQLGENTFQTVPVEANNLRKLLFAAHLAAGPHGALAGSLLEEIETLRIKYGKPPSETRHPDIGSRKSWPRATETLMATAAPLAEEK